MAASLEPTARSGASVSLSAVTLIRLWLLLLLAVLLPFRGALAAAMPCMSAGGGGHGMAQMMGAHAQPGNGHGHGHDHGDYQGRHQGHAQAHGPVHGGGAHAQGVEASHPTAHDPASAHHDPSAPDKCSACSACCASPSLPSAPMGIDEPAVLAAVSFPAFSAPEPSFQSDGPERPPRSA